MKGWRWRQRLEEIDLTTPDGHSVTLRLGMDLAWESEYYLVVDISDGGSRSGQDHSPDLLLNIPHDCITLTLPAHIKRALQLGGYEVHFKRPGEDASDPYHLILSDANLTVDIECSHHLFMDSDGQQGLTFRACVTTSSLRSTQDAAIQPGGRIAYWDAWRPGMRARWGGFGEEGGWYWNLEQKDVTLALPTSTELTLRLSFYLVWTSEYCITVGIVPPLSPQPTTARKNPRPSLSNTNSGNIDSARGGGKRSQ